MTAPVEYRIVLHRIERDPSDLALGFTAIIVANDLADAKEKAGDLARTLTGYRVVDVRPDNGPTLSASE